MRSIVVLISGSGSNLQAIMDRLAADKLDAKIELVLSNRADAYGLERAAKAGIPTAVIDHKQYDSREAFDQEMIKVIDPINPELIVLAGFMRILSEGFVEHYNGRMINGQGENLLVQSIKSISSIGAIAPFTPSGKVVVDNILASSFVAFGNDSHLSVGGINFSYQWLAHSFEFPHRMACNYLTQCLQESYTEDGVSQWVDAPHRMTLWMMNQSDLVQNLLGVLVVATLWMFNILEFMVIHPLSTAVGAYSVWRIVRRRGAKQL